MKAPMLWITGAVLSGAVRVLGRVAGRVPVVVGVSNPGLDNLVRLALEAMDQGAAEASITGQVTGVDKAVLEVSLPPSQDRSFPVPGRLLAHADLRQRSEGERGEQLLAPLVVCRVDVVCHRVAQLQVRHQHQPWPESWRSRSRWSPMETVGRWTETDPGIVELADSKRSRARSLPRRGPKGFMGASRIGNSDAQPERAPGASVRNFLN